MTRLLIWSRNNFYAGFRAILLIICGYLIEEAFLGSMFSSTLILSRKIISFKEDLTHRFSILKYSFTIVKEPIEEFPSLGSEFLFASLNFIEKMTIYLLIVEIIRALFFLNCLCYVNSSIWRCFIGSISYLQLLLERNTCISSFWMWSPSLLLAHFFT